MADNQSNARGSTSQDEVNQSGGQQRSTYVPPHARNRAPDRPSSAQFGGDRGGFGGDRGGGFGDRGGGGFGRTASGGDSRGGFGGAPREGGDGFFGRTSSGGSSGGGFGGPRAAPRGDFGNFSSSRPSSSGGFGGGGGGGFGGSSRQRVQTQEDAEIERLFDVQGQGQGINFEQYFDVPVEVGGRDPVAKFEDFNHPGLDPIRHCIEKMGYSKPTPVQQHAVPIAIAGRDLMACAQTGSGKTAAFLFPMICSTLEMYKKHGPPPPSSVAGRIKVTPVVLVLAPTRELSSQIYDEARKFTWRTGLRPVCVYGGAEQRVQLQDLDRGCDILIATPGRLVDFMERGKISLEFCRFLCLDEADRMLDMGFEPQIRRIVEHSDMPPTGAARQTLMFSATFPKEIQHLASDFLHDYLFLTVGRVGASASTVEQHVIYVRDDEKKEHVKRQLTLVEGLTLIFVETKRGADALETWLYMQGFNATSIHGDRSQFEREAALKAFKSGQSPVMVATDVAARGLDIPAVSHVINYDMPNDIDDYVHRIGRTGRAGNVGRATAFINEKNSNVARPLYDMLVESGSEVPDFLKTFGGGGRGGYGGGRGGGRGGGGRSFGGRDYRHEGGGGGGSGGGGAGGSRYGGSGGGGGGGGGDWGAASGGAGGGYYGRN